MLLEIDKLGSTDSRTPGRPRTKEAVTRLGEKGVRVTAIRSLPASLACGWEQ